MNPSFDNYYAEREIWRLEREQLAASPRVKRRLEWEDLRRCKPSQTRESERFQARLLPLRR